MADFFAFGAWLMSLLIWFAILGVIPTDSNHPNCEYLVPITLSSVNINERLSPPYTYKCSSTP